MLPIRDVVVDAFTEAILVNEEVLQPLERFLVQRNVRSARVDHKWWYLLFVLVQRVVAKVGHVKVNLPHMSRHKWVPVDRTLCVLVELVATDSKFGGVFVLKGDEEAENLVLNDTIIIERVHVQFSEAIRSILCGHSDYALTIEIHEAVLGNSRTEFVVLGANFIHTQAHLVGANLSIDVTGAVARCHQFVFVVFKWRPGR